MPIDFLARALGPLVAALTGDHQRDRRGCSARRVSNEAQITAEELRLIVERGGEQGILEAEEEQMINAVIELGDRRVHEVMVPRIAMVTLPRLGDLRGGDRHRHRRRATSRIPVYEETIDEIVGILYAKDLLPFLQARGAGAPDRSARSCGRRCSCPSR